MSNDPLYIRVQVLDKNGEELGWATTSATYLRRDDLQAVIARDGMSRTVLRVAEAAADQLTLDVSGTAARGF
jgi:hypothetical protein